MRILKHLSVWFLLLITFLVSGTVSAKVASGDQNVSLVVYQADGVVNWLTHKGKSARSITGPPGSPVVAKRGLPTNPDDLLKRGYKETTHPEAAKRGHRTFENSDGDKVRFDQGKPGKNGFEGRGHYHRYNPDATSKRNQYLDKNGNPCARGCDASHLLPGD